MNTLDVQHLILHAPVTTVTVLEDRAQVQRLGRGSFTTGLWRVVVEQVAPVLSDKSLRAELRRDYPAARVTDVRVRRQRLITGADRPERIQELWLAWQGLVEQFRFHGDDRQQLEAHYQEIRTILEKTVAELPLDAVWGQLDPKTWRDQAQALFQQLREAHHNGFNTYYQQQQIYQQLVDLYDRWQAEVRTDSVYTAYLEADLVISQPGDYDIVFDYVVPNALWRPWHQAHWLSPSSSSSQATATLNFRTDGCVWQNTGEDWSEVTLVFSTARPSLGNTPPLLQDDLLLVQEKSDQLVVERREHAVQTTGLGMGAASSMGVVPGVDDGGEVRTLRSATRATVPSDGRPYRVPLVAFSAPATIAHSLMPEWSRYVVLRSEQTNRAPVPILAGPVDLVRGTEFVGRTSIGFIAPQEAFALGWGTDANVRVQRQVSEQQAQDPLTKWQRVTMTVQLFLSNIGPASKQITLTERIPVSELEQVTVELVTSQTTSGVQKDNNGFCTWAITMTPYSQTTVQLTYQLMAAPEVQGL